ncbi:DUF481 domain-containing protein [Aurantiacibacter luteus]|uniref:Salt-induced outer membrane protein n=1 Tax=Aurantiacibacter luteus TaxID=1581420 RepID=A0A0G9MYY3_9SPHN|nr:DUF481 domain-containing protein [Aurantiacibacter luteus]KLE35956.1 hypothetical protein AAW00_06290 [Aurantiacibacter luteus]
MSKVRHGLLALALGFTIAPATVAAQSLPEPVLAMIEEAIRQGDAGQVDSVIALARTTNPAAGTELDTLQEEFHRRRREQEAREAESREAAIEAAGPLELWRGRGEVGAYRNTGNGSNVGATAAFQLTRQGDEWEHRLTGRFDYLANDNYDRTQFLLAYRPRFALSDDVFSFGLAQLEADPFQGFDRRYSVSGGLGYRVVNESDLKLSVEAGPAWRYTELAAGGEESAVSTLGTLDLDWQVAQRLKLAQDASAYIESENSSFTSVTALEAGVGGGLIARLSYAVEHDTDPPGGAEKTDTLSRFTLVYEF